MKRKVKGRLNKSRKMVKATQNFLVAIGIPRKEAKELVPDHRKSKR